MPFLTSKVSIIFSSGYVILKVIYSLVLTLYILNLEFELVIISLVSKSFFIIFTFDFISASVNSL